jgi:hypothetical protein
MQKTTYEFHLVHSNPTYEGMARVFLVKKQGKKIVRTIEIDEVTSTFLNSEFSEEEAELFGTVEEVASEKELVTCKAHDGETVELDFDKKIIWGIETFMLDEHIAFKKGRLVFLARPVSRHKYKDNPAVIDAAAKHMAIARDRASIHQRKSAVSFADDVEEYTPSKKKKRA